MTIFDTQYWKAYRQIGCSLLRAIWLALSVFALFSLPTKAADLAYWPMDEAKGVFIQDIIGSYNGSVMGNTSWVSGINGAALELDGSTSYIDMGDVLDFDTTPAFSFSVWFYALSIDTSDQRSLLSKWNGNTSTTRAYRLEIEMDHRIVALLARQLEVVKSSRQVQLEQWHHAVLTVDQNANLVVLYLDGVEEAVNRNFTRKLRNSPARFNLGQRDNGAQRFHGRLDDVKVWQRMLSASEVADIYNGIAGIDSTPPSEPEALEGTALNDSQIRLSWLAAQDVESGIRNYSIYRDNQLIATTSELEFTDTNLEPSHQYHYYVTAINGVGLESAASKLIETTTMEDSSAPPIPMGLEGNAISDSQINLSWQEVIDLGSGISHYIIYRDNQQITTTLIPSYSDLGLVSSTSYSYQVSAVNGIGLESLLTTSLDISTLEDSTPPPAPLALQVTLITETHITLNWQPVDDPNSGISHYVIYRDGLQMGTSSSTAYIDVDLQPSTLYYYEVTAVNTAGLESAPSNLLPVETLDDLSIPSTPEQLRVTVLNDSLVALVWQPSVDQQSGIDHYNIYRDGQAVAMTQDPVFTDTNLIASTLYSYQVSAVNGVGLESLSSNSVEVSTEVDHSPPPIPQGVEASALSEVDVTLTWQPVIDPESGISHYQIYRNGENVGSAKETSFIDSTLMPNTSYLYQISATNWAGLESQRSPELLIVTPDLTSPLLSSVSAIQGSITLIFNEPIETISATRLENYLLDSQLTLEQSLHIAGQAVVTLLVSGQIPGELYPLQLDNIQDMSGNIIAPTSINYLVNTSLFDQQGTLWSPYLEWTVEDPSWQDNPYDVIATATFVHTGNGAVHQTGMFYAGDNNWKFRFTGTQIGQWTFTTSSIDPDLANHSGTVIVVPNQDPAARGFVSHIGSTWSWSGSGKAYVPQLVMYAMPIYFADSPAVIDADIDTFFTQHGFNGFHILGANYWFDINQTSSYSIEQANPDPLTFEAIEMLLAKVYSAGGMVHFWLWGDESRHWTPALWGING